jgi:cytochrome c-type biogenesis protein CcmH
VAPRLWLAALAASLCVATAAQEARPLADDPVLEAQVLRISAELRCLVCQNETIAASNADLAVDLRKQIRQQLRQGKSEAEILDFMVQRYGDFVLYRPPLKGTTLLLWVGPFALLVVGALTLSFTLRRRRRALAAAAPSEADHQRARALLDAGDPSP